ncbi:MAG: AtpZ/AtpI family protein [Acidobacteria bacterium]|nr:AtpZ/AtpI family protein [Acidobacteriota bacterium]
MRASPLLARRMPDPSDHFFARSLQAWQENVRRAGPAASAGYTLIGAILGLGGVGHLVDRWATTSPWFLLTGLLVGLVIGFYELAKTVWKR